MHRREGRMVAAHHPRHAAERGRGADESVRAGEGAVGVVGVHQQKVRDVNGRHEFPHGPAPGGAREEEGNKEPRGDGEAVAEAGEEQVRHGEQAEPDHGEGAAEVEQVFDALLHRVQPQRRQLAVLRGVERLGPTWLWFWGLMFSNICYVFTFIC